MIIIFLCFYILYKKIRNVPNINFFIDLYMCFIIPNTYLIVNIINYPHLILGNFFELLV